MEIKKLSNTSLAKSSTYMYRYYIIIIYVIRILHRYWIQTTRTAKP